MRTEKEREKKGRTDVNILDDTDIQFFFLLFKLRAFYTYFPFASILLSGGRDSTAGNLKKRERGVDT